MPTTWVNISRTGTIQTYDEAGLTYDNVGVSYDSSTTPSVWANESKSSAPTWTAENKS